MEDCNCNKRRALCQFGGVVALEAIDPRWRAFFATPGGLWYSPGETTVPQGPGACMSCDVDARTTHTCR